MSFVSASREDVKNSLTEKCENCITWESSTSTMESKLGVVDSTVSTGSPRHQPSWNFGIGPVLKSNESISASSVTRSGRKATATH